MLNLNREITPDNLKKIGLFLLVLLLLVYVLWAWYIPALSLVDEIDSQREMVALENDRLIAQASMADELRAEQASLQENLIKRQNSYFTQLHQEDIIILLDTLARDLDIRLGNLSFSDPTLGAADAITLDRLAWEQEFESIAALLQGEADHINPSLVINDTEEDAPMTLQLQELLVGVHMEGSYQQCISFIQAIETFPYDVGINNFSIQPVASDILTDQVSVSMNLWFYALPDPFAQDNRLIRVTAQSSAPKTNPFQSRVSP